MVVCAEIEPVQQVANLEGALERFFSEGAIPMGIMDQKDVSLSRKTAKGDRISFVGYRYPNKVYHLGVTSEGYLFNCYLSLTDGFSIINGPLQAWVQIDEEKFLLQYLQDSADPLVANLELVGRKQIKPGKGWRQLDLDAITELKPAFTQAGCPSRINLVDTMMTYLTQERYFGGQSTGEKVTAESVAGNLFVPSDMSSEAF